MSADRQNPYDTRDRDELAATAVAQSYLAIAIGMPLQFLTELALRLEPGFADDEPSDAAIRYLVPAAIGAVAYAASRFTGFARRTPFVQAYAIVLVIAAILGRAAHHTGGAVSPYAVSLCTVLFCWSLIMPGGARYALFPVLGSLATFYSVLYVSGGRAFFEGRSTAFALFTTSSSFFSVAYAEVLERWRRRVSTASTTDALTTLLSRAYLLERFDQLYADALEQSHAVSVLMVDVDHFKRVNDTHGHAVGDRVLQKVADVLGNATRKQDACGRLGGEEFVLVLDRCGEAQALDVAQRIRQGIADVEFAAESGPFRVTVSIGIASLPEGGYANTEQVLRAADRALYASKDGGRDRVSVARD
jgi:diguanylate cyclase (GGDEF)-like protein